MKASCAEGPTIRRTLSRTASDPLVFVVCGFVGCLVLFPVPERSETLTLVIGHMHDLQ